MIKDDCDKAWDELYGEEYGMSDALPCEPYYGFFCAGWNKSEERFVKCSNCKHWSKTWELCHYSMGDEEYSCKGRDWELKE